MKFKLTAVTLLLFGALGLFPTSALARPEPLIISEDSRAGRRPGTTPFGTYAALDLSIRNGEVSTINSDTVLRYGKPTLVRYHGVDYWQVPVTYRHRIFGNGVIISEARALVRNGQVEHWVFRNSSLPVP
ncbi:MAG: hypothetical protein U0984_08185 [Prosthecobacter sp.]|nr:hypothetical protein [Prosthecobacter sp.]